MAVDGITQAELAAAREVVLAEVRAETRRTLAGGSPSVQVCRWPDGSGWYSPSEWLGPLARTEELALVSVAVGLVERIAASTGWGDDHQIRLDLMAELDAIDGRAFELAGMDRSGRPAQDTYGAVLARSWESLVDRVAALYTYAERLPEPVRQTMPSHRRRSSARGSLTRLDAGLPKLNTTRSFG